MREIKFRAWDKKYGAWVKNMRVYQNGAAADDNSWLPSKDIALMQFTGLHDRSGREVYEGDILKWRKHPRATEVGEVLWNQSSASFCVKDQNELEKERGFWRPVSLYAMNSIEVIGNIYENPELLGDAKEAR